MPFRFAVQATPRDAAQWLATARRAEELGYSTLLMPDGMQLPSPLPALALAAGATTTLHVGTFVLASPLRPPRLAAWDARSLSQMADGRFERRRDSIGVSYFSVNAAFTGQFGPVVELLSGR